MALRRRDLVTKTQTTVDIENMNPRPVAKAALKVSQLTSRPPLDELSNKITGQKAVSKKEELNKNVNFKPPFKKETRNVIKSSYSSEQLGLGSVTDPDAEYKDDPQMVTEYASDIFNYLLKLEQKFPIKEKFLEGHPSSPKMRTILVNWLVLVHQNFKLVIETLYMCVSIVDRYLQENKNIARETLQLVGTSALLIACKYEELYVPVIDDFVYICDDTFTKKQIFKMEIDILKRLECNLGQPLSIHFLRRYSKILKAKPKEHTLAKYVLELALLDHNMSHIRPSIQAAAACCLAVSVLTSASCPSKVWTPTLVHYSTYKYSDFKQLVFKFASMLLAAENMKNQAIQTKYSDSSFHKISTDSHLRGNFVKQLAEKASKS